MAQSNIDDDNHDQPFLYEIPPNVWSINSRPLNIETQNNAKDLFYDHESGQTYTLTMYFIPESKVNKKRSHEIFKSNCSRKVWHI